MIQETWERWPELHTFHFVPNQNNRSEVCRGAWRHQQKKLNLTDQTPSCLRCLLSYVLHFVWNWEFVLKLNKLSHLMIQHKLGIREVQLTNMFRWCRTPWLHLDFWPSDEFRLLSAWCCSQVVIKYVECKKTWTGLGMLKHSKASPSAFLHIMLTFSAILNICLGVWDQCFVPHISFPQCWRINKILRILKAGRAEGILAGSCRKVAFVCFLPIVMQDFCWADKVFFVLWVISAWGWQPFKVNCLLPPSHTAAVISWLDKILLHLNISFTHTDSPFFSLL